MTPTIAAPPVSVFDLFTIGIGPSSSHTVGPMRAARKFTVELAERGLLDSTASVCLELYGSLAATGPGHGTPGALILGLEGAQPETIEPTEIPQRLARIRGTGTLRLLGTHPIAFNEADHLVLHRRTRLPTHSNGMRFCALDHAGDALAERTYFSVGGGTVIEDGEEVLHDTAGGTAAPYAFSSADELLALCRRTGLRISRIMLENELASRSEDQIRAGLVAIWNAMQQCVERGSSSDGELPGGLRVTRRAAALKRSLEASRDQDDDVRAMDWVSLFAMAVNEENACGGRVVTAPTNGAAGIVPAVLHYYVRFVPDADEDGVIRFLLTAGAIGTLYKRNASISGAEVGCQGEVGSACSMAAAGLAEVLGGTPEQIENAAEIGMEHNLGLTCDPVGGLVQIPCIERNALAAIKAIAAARLALRGHGHHRVSLDKVIQTMRETGADMNEKYKETSHGGLAVNVTEC